jgi:hypothetical protein
MAIIRDRSKSKTLQSEGFVNLLLRLKPEDHGWERFGVYNDNVFLQPFVEGAWDDE